MDIEKVLAFVVVALAGVGLIELIRGACKLIMCLVSGIKNDAETRLQIAAVRLMKLARLRFGTSQMSYVSLTLKTEDGASLTFKDSGYKFPEVEAKEADNHELQSLSLINDLENLQNEAVSQAATNADVNVRLAKTNKDIGVIRESIADISRVVAAMKKSVDTTTANVAEAMNSLQPKGDR